MTATRTTVWLLAGALLLACGERVAEDTETPAQETPAMRGMEEVPPAQDTAMPGMPGMPGMRAMPSQMDQVVSHMRMMEGLSPEAMQEMLPMHRQMAANALAQMNAEMRAMNMTGDARWNALTDSIRQDLTRMPEMTTAELQRALPDHRHRLERLDEMHRTMMGSPPAGGPR